MTTRSSAGSLTIATQTKNTRVNGEVVLGSLGSNTTKWTNTVDHGPNVPGWREALIEGRDATTTLTGSKVVARYTPGRAVASRPKTGPATTFYSTEWIGGMGVNTQLPSGEPTDIDFSKANNLALGKLARRITEMNTAFQGGVFLGELKQNLQAIRNPAKGLRDLADNWGATARRIRGSRVWPLAFRKKKVAEALADSWLEVQFGWRPLLNDIADASSALHRYKVGQVARTRRITVKGETEGTSLPFVGSSAANLLTVFYENLSSDHTTVVYRGAMRVEARNPQTMDPDLLGFNLGNWIPTAWELVPYSFLIDYFTNVGDVINGWSTLATRLAWCNRTVIREKRVRSTTWTSLAACKESFPTLTSVSIVPSKSIISKISVLRASHDGTYVPGLVFEVPSLGSLKWLNIAALIAGRASDRRWSYGD